MSAFCTPVALPSASPLVLHKLKITPHAHVFRRRRIPLLATAASPLGKASSIPSFGRGARFPKRLVGLYELERLGVDPNRLLAPNKSAQQGLGAIIGFGVLATFAVPLLSPWVQAEAPVALLIGSILFIWAFDTLSLGGVLQRAASVALQSSRRIAVHEAGHFLVAHLMGIGVSRYSLPSAASSLSGAEMGVQVEEVQDSDAYTVAALGMAGIAAECVIYGDSQGGAEDLAEVGKIAAKSGPFGKATAQDRKIIIRWALIQAVSLIKAHKESLETLAEAMMKGLPLEECIKLIDESVDAEALRQVDTA